jgi:hypothetical protein
MLGSDAKPLHEMWEWRRSRINRAAHDLPPRWAGVTQFPTVFFVQRPNLGPAGRRAAHLRSVAGQVDPNGSMTKNVGMTLVRSMSHAYPVARAS